MSAAAQHQIDLALKFIDTVRADPVWFARDVLNHKALPGEPTLAEDPQRSWELDQFQIDILQACADVWRKKQGLPTVINHEGINQITVRSGHGPGKTYLAALVAHWFNTAFPARTVCTAPKLAQVRTRLWASIRKIDARAEAWYRSTHTIHDTAVYWRHYDERGREVVNKNWCILGETATHPESIAGHHERHQLIEVEEATGVPEPLYPVIFGALSSGELQLLLLISNPSKNTGTFASSHLSAREAKNYFRYHITLANAKRINRDWVAKMETKYGKSSPVVKIRCHGDFADASPKQLIPTAWVIDAIERECRPADGSVPHIRVTIDVSDGGEDETVIWVFRTHDSFATAVEMRRHSFDAVDATALAADAAEAAFTRWGGNKDTDDFVVDSLGVGTGTRDGLIRKGYRVIEYQGGAGSDNPDRWRNRRVQSYLCLRDALRDKQLEFTDSCFDSSEDADEFMAQLACIELTDQVSGERLEDLVTKTAMKTKGLPSPDIPDALAMLYATQAPQMARPNGQTLGSMVTVVRGTDFSEADI